jgi:hypothetical protein
VSDVTSNPLPSQEVITLIDSVEGYCGRLSYAPGDTVTLHTSARCATYDVTIERWGAARELVWHADDVRGAHYPAPPDASAKGCDWPAAPVTISIGADWRSGYYLLTMSPSDGARVTHAGFVVRAAGTRARTLLVVATNTYNAYNAWGGRSLYTGGTDVSFRRPYSRGLLCRDDVERDDRKSRPTRWGEQPEVDGAVFQSWRHSHGYPPSVGSTGWFTFERRFVEWAERAGYQFDYAISTDLADDPSVLDGYDLVLSVGHDEYWSPPQRNALERYVAEGGNVASFSGNTMFWHVRMEDDGDTMVCHKYSAHETDPIRVEHPEQITGMWADRQVNRPEWTFLGAGSAYGLYSRFGQATPRGSGAFTVYRHGHWLFDGTGLRYGDELGADHGIVGYETVGCRLDLDEFQLPVARGGDGTPTEIEVVAWTPASNITFGEYPASTSSDAQADLPAIADRVFGGLDEASLAKARYGNAVMLVCRPFAGGGEVVTIGTTDWVFGLADPSVSQVTHNVMRRFTERS